MHFRFYWLQTAQWLAVRICAHAIPYTYIHISFHRWNSPMKDFHYDPLFFLSPYMRSYLNRIWIPSVAVRSDFFSSRIHCSLIPSSPPVYSTWKQISATRRSCHNEITPTSRQIMAQKSVIKADSCQWGRFPGPFEINEPSIFISCRGLLFIENYDAREILFVCTWDITWYSACFIFWIACAGNWLRTITSDQIV